MANENIHCVMNSNPTSFQCLVAGNLLALIELGEHVNLKCHRPLGHALAHMVNQVLKAVESVIMLRT